MLCYCQMVLDQNNMCHPFIDVRLKLSSTISCIMMYRLVDVKQQCVFDASIFLVPVCMILKYIHPNIVLNNSEVIYFVMMELGLRSKLQQFIMALLAINDSAVPRPTSKVTRPVDEVKSAAPHVRLRVKTQSICLVCHPVYKQEPPTHTYTIGRLQVNDSIVNTPLLMGLWMRL